MAHPGRSKGKRNKKGFNSMFHAVFSLFVDSPLTINGPLHRDKQQIAEMEKAAKAAFSCCITLLKFASSDVITAGS